MGSGEEWANDAPEHGWSCPIVLVSLVSGAIVGFFGIVVLVRDVVMLALQ